MKKNILLIMGLILLSCVLVITSCEKSKEKPTDISATPIEKTEDIIQKGEYLVNIMGCNDCHSPKRMGAQGPEIIPELLLSGFQSDSPPFTINVDDLTKEGFAIFYPDLTASKGPWGTSYAANLTPDATGIGDWSEAQFKKAITEGKFKGLDNGRLLLPPMPWASFINLKNEDIHAIFSYLKSIKPVHNIVPEADIVQHN
ncbi:c-type cytochrome [Flavobacterium chuncheonense]|uniref:C-type cytochrome n=1 Tax=Flavobacterium chuncheonense TaxID=2026653 RepID=A0ABW5YNW9_9FLAO